MRTVALRKLLDPHRPLTYGIVQAGPNVEGGVPYIRPVDMSQNLGVHDQSSLLRTSPEIANAYSRSSVRTGDIVLSIGPSFGKVMVVPSSLDGANLTQGTARLTVGDDADARWMYWVLQAKRSTAFWEAVSAGGTFRALNLGPLGDTPVTLMPLEEQRRIADFLDDRVGRIDQIIAARREQIAHLVRAASGRLQAAFDTLAAEFGTVRLGHAINGIEQGRSPQAEGVPAGPHEWGVMRSGCVNGGVFKPEDNKRLPDGLSPREEYRIREGDLLMSRASGSLDLIGSVAVVPEGVRDRLLLCDKIYRIEPAGGWSRDFLALMLRAHSNRERIRLGVSGAEGMANNLPSGVVRDLRIPRVPAEAQQEVAEGRRREARVDAKARAALSRSIDLLTEYKTSLITAAVTGELDVTTAGSGIPG